MTELQKCEFAKQKGFTYCPMSGDIRGIHGKVIKRKKADGYISCQIHIDKKKHELYAHRLAWFIHYGELPVNQLDHIDGDKSNNKINNLRDVTAQQNQWNRTTAKGFYWNKERKKFASYINLNGKMITLGLFTTETEARNAYLEGKKKYHTIIK